MSGYAFVRDQSDREAAGRMSNWARDYVHRVALVDLGCATVGVLVAAQIRFGKEVTRPAPGPDPRTAPAMGHGLVDGGAYDTRFIGTGSDEFRRVLNAGVSLTAAVAVFSYAVNLATIPRLRGHRPAKRHGARSSRQVCRCASNCIGSGACVASACTT